MKDAKGNTLQVNDSVVFVQNANRDPRITTGKITKIYKNDRECTVDNSPHIYGYRILKWPTEL